MIVSVADHSARPGSDSDRGSESSLVHRPSFKLPSRLEMELERKLAIMIATYHSARPHDMHFKLSRTTVRPHQAFKLQVALCRAALIRVRVLPLAIQA